MRLKKWVKICVTPIVGISLLVGCASVTKSGAISGGRSQIMLMPSSTAFEMGHKFYAQELEGGRKKMALDTDKAMVVRLQKIAKRLIPHVAVYREDALSWPWEVHVLKSETLNAYCTGQGKIMFYTGIVEKLALNDEEIAAIMGHEMAHALREHVREQMSQNYAQNMVISVGASALGLGQLGTQVAGKVSEVVISLPFGRSHETEADLMGLELMARAGYNPQASVSVWKKMKAHSKGGEPMEFLSTHPSHENRITDLEKELPKAQELYAQTQKR